MLRYRDMAIGTAVRLYYCYKCQEYDYRYRGMPLLLPVPGI